MDLVLQVFLGVFEPNYLLTETRIVLVQVLYLVLLDLKELFGLVQEELDFLKFLVALFERQGQVQLLLLEVRVIFNLLLQFIPHFLDITGLLVARRRFVCELLIQIPTLNLLFLVITLSLLCQRIQILYLLHELRDLLLRLCPLLVKLLLMGVLELLYDLVLLRAEIVDLGQVRGLDVVDYSLVLILQ